MDIDKTCPCKRAVANHREHVAKGFPLSSGWMQLEHLQYTYTSVEQYVHM